LYLRSRESFFADNNFVQRHLGSADHSLSPRLFGKFKLGRYP
jgi:hypothetical protein